MTQIPNGGQMNPMLLQEIIRRHGHAAGSEGEIFAGGVRDDQPLSARAAVTSGWPRRRTTRGTPLPAQEHGFVDRGGCVRSGPAGAAPPRRFRGRISGKRADQLDGFIGAHLLPDGAFGSTKLRSLEVADAKSVLLGGRNGRRAGRICIPV